MAGVIMVGLVIPLPLDGDQFGKEFVRYVASFVFVGTAVLALVGPGRSQKSLLFGGAQMDAKSVSNYILQLVSLDALALTVLIAQEQGICKTLFLPVLFTLPTAFLVVEEDITGRNRDRMYIVLLLVATALAIGFVISQGHPNHIFLLLLTLPTSAFPDAASHTGFHVALLLASSVSLVVPLVELLVAYWSKQPATD